MTSINSSRTSFIPIFIIGILFFIFGFVTWLNGALIPFLQTACEISAFEASLVTFAFYISYFLTALPSSFILKRIGYKNGLVLGLLIMAIGAILFIPAAYSRLYIIFLSGLLVLGTGLSLLQTAVNPYITNIGPRDSAAARISMMGICNKLAGFLSPLILTTLVMHGMDKFKEENLKLLSFDQKNLILNELAIRLVWPYCGLAFLLVLLAVVIKFSKLPDPIEEGESKSNISLPNFIKQIPGAIKIKHMTLGVIAIFVYVGAEVIAGDSLTQYGKSLHLSQSSVLTSYTMAFMVLGYIIGIILIPKYLSQAKALLFSTILGIILSVLAIFASNTDVSIFQSCFSWLSSIFPFNIPVIPNSIFFITLLGFANAIMWPAIWPLSLDGVGQYTKIASALLIMAILGGAILPPTYAKMGQVIGFQNALWILLPCYFYIMFFAVKGHKLKGQ